MYYLSRFGNDGELVLPTGNVKNDMGSLSTVDTGIQVAGGAVFDTYGSDVAPSGQTSFTHRCSLVNNSAADLETAYRALLARRGSVQRLFRTWVSSGLSEWVYARLMRVSAQHDPRFRTRISGLTCQFDLRSPHWNGARHGDGWELDTGEYLDSGLVFDDGGADAFTMASATTSFSVTNGGNVDVHAATMRFFPNGSAITKIEVSAMYDAVMLPFFTWTDAIGVGVGYALVVDFATKAVTISAISDAYSGFDLHRSKDDWLTLAPGVNSFEVTRTGGDATSYMNVGFYDGWA